MNQAKLATINITLRGIRDIMFDRYPGDNNTVLPPEQRLYYAKDGETLVVPALNILSFLSAKNSKSAPKALYDARKYKGIADALLNFTTIDPMDIVMTRGGKPITFRGFDKNGITLFRGCPRMKDNVPNPKIRPVVNLPWELSFQLQLFPNDTICESEVQQLFVAGGRLIGLGTYRGVFGKFEVDSWESLKVKAQK